LPTGSNLPQQMNHLVQRFQALRSGGFRSTKLSISTEHE